MLQTTQGVMSLVRNQEQYESWWHTSTTSAPEDTHALSLDKHVSPPKQQFADCNMTDHEYNVGLMNYDSAFSVKHIYTAQDRICDLPCCQADMYQDSVVEITDVFTDGEQT